MDTLDTYRLDPRRKAFDFLPGDFLSTDTLDVKRHTFVPKVYVIGSLRNPVVQDVANKLRTDGFEVFDDWSAVGPEADDHWKTYEQGRGRNFKQALCGKSCENTFNFDRRNIDAADIGVMVMPAGKSGHIELGYMAGKGKRTFVLLQEDSDRWDIMYKFFTGIVYDYKELVREIHTTC